MPAPNFEVPSGSITEQQEYWQANPSRWFIHWALQEIRGWYAQKHRLGEMNPYDALMEVAIDQRVETEGLDPAEFNQAIVEQYARFNQNRPRGVQAAASLMIGIYRERTWGMPGKDY